MPILDFSHYNLRAPRPLLDQLCAFYIEVVGLRLGERPPFRSFGFWLYAGERDVLHLTEASAQEVRAIDVTTTFDHAAFACRDLAEYEQRLATRGIDYRSARVPQTGQVQWFLRDPAGNGVELNFSDG